MNDKYVPNNYSFELNPEMLEALREEFSAETVVEEFSKAIEGKSSEEIDAEGEKFFDAFGRNWMQKTYKLGDEDPDRTYEVLKAESAKAGGHWAGSRKSMTPTGRKWGQRPLGAIGSCVRPQHACAGPRRG